VKDIVDLQCDASAAERSTVVIIIALPPIIIALPPTDQ
jgi:hypothetical protein